jgi:hypothetical protein
LPARATDGYYGPDWGSRYLTVGVNHFRVEERRLTMSDEHITEGTESEPVPGVRLARGDDERDDRPPTLTVRPMAYLPEMEARRAQPATMWQRRFLEARGLWRDGLTLGEAYDLVGQIKHEERVRSMSPVRPQRKPK